MDLTNTVFLDFFQYRITNLMEFLDQFYLYKGKGIFTFEAT